MLSETHSTYYYHGIILHYIVWLSRYKNLTETRITCEYPNISLTSFFESRYSQMKARCKERVEQQSEKTGTVLDFISAQIEERPLVLGHAKYRGKHNMYPGPRTYQSVQFLDKGMMNLISNLLHALESLRHILIAISICSFESMQAEKWKYLFSEISSAVFFKYKRQRLGRQFNYKTKTDEAAPLLSCWFFRRWIQESTEILIPPKHVFMYFILQFYDILRISFCAREIMVGTLLKITNPMQSYQEYNSWY